MAKAKDLTIVTCRDIFQEEEESKGVFSDEYRDLSALIVLDKNDMKMIGVEDGQTVLVENDWGSVVVNAKLSEDDESHSGLATMPSGPWSNQLISGEIGTNKIPDFKRTAAKVSASGKEVTSISELIEKIKSA
ncbi:MAG: molybdopterin dinucleotide binding domain-containing protein [Methanotrichaceae archaeon]